MEFPKPIIGVLLGLCIIFFRKKISIYIERFYKNFPQNKDAVETLNIKFEIRPIFIAILGAVLILMSVLGLIKG
jgi:ABC-type lipoprotein release transport system permease subunit